MKIMQIIRLSAFFWVFYGVLLACEKKEKTSAEPSVYSSGKPSVQQSPKFPEKKVQGYKTYSGAWFEVEYPADFIAAGSQKSLSSAEGFDSALFTSPDGRVQFYVFSPQWHGRPQDIQLQSGETIIDSSEEKKDHITIKRWTIVNNDQHFTRTYEETMDDTGPVNKIFGIRYSSPRELKKYHDQYLYFKSSLKQFSD